MRLAHLVLTALVGLTAMGVALHGPDPLLNAPGDAELDKFAVVDMADALDRVAGPASN